MTMQFVKYSYTSLGLATDRQTETWINWLTPIFGSSTIMAVGHDYADPDNNLYVHFHRGGIYMYPGAGWQYAVNMMMANSPGNYFHKQIKDKMPCHKLNQYEVLKHG